MRMESSRNEEAWARYDRMKLPPERVGTSRRIATASKSSPEVQTGS